MENEAQQYRENLSQKSTAIKGLERRVAALEIEVQDVHQKVRVFVGSVALGTWGPYVCTCNNAEHASKQRAAKAGS
jgi:hypothetical protein